MNTRCSPAFPGLRSASSWLGALALAATLVAPTISTHAANLPPKVSILQPRDGTLFVNPSEIAILVEAADGDGRLRSVELFTDLGSLGVVSIDPVLARPIQPVQWTWKQPPVGEHKLVAQATDDQGATAFSESIVIGVKQDADFSPASLVFVKPADGASLPVGVVVSLELTAVDPNGDIRHVEFFAADQSIGRSDHLTKEAVIPGRPRQHVLEWTPDREGRRQLTAKAVDTLGHAVVSKPLAVIVGRDLPVVSIVPSVAETSEPGPTIRVRPGVFTLKRSSGLESPLSVFLKYEGSATPGADYEELPATVTFQAGQPDLEIRVQAVEDGVVEGIETVAATLDEPILNRLPDYNVDFQNRAAKVMIHDTTGSGGKSAWIEMTSPVQGQVFKPGDLIALGATAVDLESYLSRVEFYDFEKQIGFSEITFIRAPDPGTPIQHNFEWSGAPEGEHVITGRAKDLSGRLVISPPVQIKVGPGGAAWPVVGVSVLDPEGTEFPPEVDAFDPVRFEIRRDGDLSRDLDVYFALQGSAVAEKDYKSVGRNVRIPAGERAINLEIVPISDGTGEGMETVAIRLIDAMLLSSVSAPPTPYQIDPSFTEAAGVIYEGQPPAKGALEWALPGEGEGYAPSRAVHLVAAAVHPSFDLNRVEFFANDKLIGVSEIVFGKIQPGGLIMHAFDWKEPTPGDVALVARAKLPDGSELVSRPLRIQVGPSAPATVVLEVVPEDQVASETAPDNAPDPAVFRIERTAGPKDVEVIVYYQVDGSARNGVDYAELEGKIVLPAGEESVALVVKPVADGIAEGDETVAIILTTPICPAIYPPPPWCYTLGPSSAAKAVIRDRDGDPASGSVVRILRPQNGAVFAASTTVEVGVAARSANGTIERLDLFVDDALVESTKFSELSLKLDGLALGAHVLSARVLDSHGKEIRAEPVKVLVVAADRLPPVDSGKVDAAGVGQALAEINRIEYHKDGNVRLQLKGPDLNFYQIEVSSDLIHWQPLAPVFLADGQINFDDQGNAGRQRRFYRVQSK